MTVEESGSRLIRERNPWDSDSDLPRTILGLIDESSDNTPKITEADVHGNANAPFQTATDIVPVPCHAERDKRIDTFWSRKLAA